MKDRNPTHGFNSLGNPVHAVTIDHLSTSNKIQRFNASVAMMITKIVGTMWCAYGFACFDLLSLPAAIRGGTLTLVSWVAQTFLQLVLLSVIMVGQNIQGKASDARSGLTFDHLNFVMDKVDETTEGGIKAVLDKIDELEKKISNTPT